MKPFIVTIFLTSIYAFTSAQTNLSPENQPGVNYSLTKRLWSEFNTIRTAGKTEVIARLPEQDDVDKFYKAKTLLDLGNTGVIDVEKADSVFSLFLDGRCVVRTSSHKDLIYSNMKLAEEDIKWFETEGIKCIAGLVYKYPNQDLILTCTYEKKE